MSVSTRGRGLRPHPGKVVLAAILSLTVPHLAHGAKPVFKHALDGSTIDTPLKPGETETPALKQFKETGTNPYRDDAAAIAAGKALYDQHCQVCHNADATGKMGPALVGKEHVYPQTATDAGMFAVIYAGASGAMQPFAKRELSQDDMLKIIAYVRSLDK